MAEGISNPHSNAGDVMFDEAAALDALDGDRELLAIVCRAFVEEAPKLLARLHRTLDERDAQGVHAAGHALKGAVRFFGETPIYHLAYSLESNARTGNLDRAKAEIAQLDVCVPRLATQLTRLLRQHPSASRTAPS